MKLIIDIPENDYELVLQNDYSTIYKGTHIAEAIKKGTPFPEHHGRLMILSEDKVKENQIKLDFSCQKWISEVDVSNATVTIIEADREE